MHHKQTIVPARMPKNSQKRKIIVGRDFLQTIKKLDDSTIKRKARVREGILHQTAKKLDNLIFEKTVSFRGDEAQKFFSAMTSIHQPNEGETDEQFEARLSCVLTDFL
jgi:hypothetical protein